MQKLLEDNNNRRITKNKEYCHPMEYKNTHTYQHNSVKTSATLKKL